MTNQETYPPPEPEGTQPRAEVEGTPPDRIVGKAMGQDLETEEERRHGTVHVSEEPEVTGTPSEPSEERGHGGVGESRDEP